MSTVFSYIVQKRLSKENENVATEALAFIVRSSECARSGLMKLLHGIAPELPTSLRFDTQHSFDIEQSEGSARPDMWGFDGATPRVLIENKFWAGLTVNQPVEYLRKLAAIPAPGLLLMVVPDARQETVSRECLRCIAAAGLTCSTRNRPSGVYRADTIDIGDALAVKPTLAITSWVKLLSAIEAELTDEPERRNDLRQLRALCDAADEEYAPFTTMELTNQRTASFFLHLNAVVQKVVDLGVSETFLSIAGVKPQHFWDAHGRYLKFPTAMGVGAWFGTHLRLWRGRGTTPLWLYFPRSGFGRALEVRAILEPWIERNGIAWSAEADGGYAVGIDVVPGEEQDHVIRSVVIRLRDIAAQLSRLPAKPGVTP
jgi:hypothetical protein